METITMIDHYNLLRATDYGSDNVICMQRMSRCRQLTIKQFLTSANGVWVPSLEKSDHSPDFGVSKFLLVVCGGATHSFRHQRHVHLLVMQPFQHRCLRIRHGLLHGAISGTHK